MLRYVYTYNTLCDVKMHVVTISMIIIIMIIQC